MLHETLNVPTDWWRTFFSGVAVDFWLKAVPEKQTGVEVDFIRKMIQVLPPAKLLDVACGGGRHSVALAAAGYQMTGVDISPEFLAAARIKASEQKLSIHWNEREMRDLPWHEEFDGAFCFGNAFGYDDDDGNAAFLKAVFRTLRPGARFVLDCPMVAEARLPSFHERSWYEVDGIFFLEDEAYDHTQGRIVTEYTFIRGDRVDKRLASHRIYTYRQIYELVEDAGFMDIQAYGSLTEEPFQLGSNALYLVATRGER